MLVAFLRFEPLVRLKLGPLAISPHGVGIAVGFLLGSWYFLTACRRRGFTDDQVYALVNRAAVGAIIGARVAYVINHPGDFSHPLEVFAVWKGGISLLGGIAGAILAGVPKMRSEGLSFWKVMDLAVPGVVMGIVVGRVGDLIIGDHLGKPTRFFLGYQCPDPCPPGSTSSPYEPMGAPAVHLPALYDLVSAVLLLALLWRLRRTRRYDGFLTLVFGAWYGAGRLAEDFFRVDVTHGLGLTGSQWTAVVVMALCWYGLVVVRDTPWASGRGTMASVPRRSRPADEAVAKKPPTAAGTAMEPDDAEVPSRSESEEERAPASTEDDP